MCVCVCICIYMCIHIHIHTSPIACRALVADFLSKSGCWTQMKWTCMLLLQKSPIFCQALLAKTFFLAVGHFWLIFSRKQVAGPKWNQLVCLVYNRALFRVLCRALLGHSFSSVRLFCAYFLAFCLPGTGRWTWMKSTWGSKSSGLWIICASLSRCSSALQCIAVCCSVSQLGFAGHLRLSLDVLQCAAVCCSVMQCVAVCCNVLQCVAVCCRALPWNAMRCSMLQLGFMDHLSLTLEVLQCDVVRCSVLQCVAMCCSVLQSVAVCSSALQCVAVRCRAL